MKKIIALLVFIQALHISYAQQGFEFKTKYKPETKYSQTIEQKGMTVLKYSGSKKVMNEMKKQGVKNPTVETLQSVMKAEIITGKQKGDEPLPLTIEFTDVSGNEQTEALLEGLIMYGHSSTGVPTIDSIVGNEHDDEFKKLFLTTLQSIFSQVTFPERYVKVGEQFTQQTPISVPVAGIKFDMDINTVYKLTRIEGGIGYFGITQTYTMKTDIMDYEVTATGSGSGTMEFDIANTFYRKYAMEITMKMGLNMEGVLMTVEVKSNSTQSIVISAN